MRTRFEKEYRRIFSENKIGTTVWSPLGGGILAGKYNEGAKVAGARYEEWKGPIMDKIWSKYMNEQNLEGTLKKMRAMGDYAKELGYTQAQLALAWVLASTDVSTCMLGFSRLE